MVFCKGSCNNLIRDEMKRGDVTGGLRDAVKDIAVRSLCDAGRSKQKANNLSALMKGMTNHWERVK